MDSIYLDNNSTTRIFEEVVDVMTDCYRQGFLNPASQHQSGRRARRVIEDARDQIACHLNAGRTAPKIDKLVFTSGGTESNNLAIHGLTNSNSGNVLVSQIEHPSVLEPALQLSLCGLEIRKVPVNSTGHVEISEIEKRLDEDTKLVCVMLANNEIGTIQPVPEIGEMCRRNKVPFHCDAVQAVGKLPIDFQRLQCDTLAFSAHKFHGPRGVGGLLIRHDINIQPFLVGGSQQLGIRPGTESIAQVVGMQKAFEIVASQTPNWAVRVQPLRDRLEATLKQRCGAVCIGAEPRMPHTTNLAFPGLDRQVLIMALDLAGIECSTGSACTSGSSEPSHVVLATGVPQDLVESSIRLSVSMHTSDSDIDCALDRFSAVIDQLRQTAAKA